MTPAPTGEDTERNLLGSDLGRFHDLQELGAGGMGVVYRAVDSKLKRPVALKLLPAALAADPDRMARFEREAETVAGLNHPNIVTVYSVEEAGEHRFIAMELVEGESLDRIIPKGGLPIEDFFEIAVSLADALSVAHAKQIVHRDLKPANIMRTPSGLVKVLDFGLAKLYSQPEPAAADDETVLAPPELTQEGVIAGTPGYMSPEQIRGETIDHRTDIFALGIVLYEMATGDRPFSGGSVMDLASSILRDEPVSVTYRREKLPRHLGRIVSHCLEKDPDKRIQTAKDLRNQLAGLQKELETERILGRSTSSATRPASPRLSRPAIWGAATVLAAAAIVTALWVSRTSEQPRIASDVSDSSREVQAATRPLLAVLPFQNLSSDAATDWLSTGIPEMLITSLSESKGIEVLPGRRVHQVLEQLDVARAETLGEDAVTQFVEVTEVTNLVRGSFVKLGDRYRIDLRIEEAGSGSLVFANRAEGVGDAGIFSMVDGLSRGVLEQLDASATADIPEPQIQEVTTSSMEAFRYYTEGVLLAYQIKRRESLTMFEKAVELDPGFAMALLRISNTYLNLGDAAKAKEYARRAFENSARAPARERHFIEGCYLSMDWETYGQAIEAFRRTVEQYPDHGFARNILANRLTALGDYRSAIPHLEQLISENPRYGGHVWLLSSLLAAEGRFEDGQAVIEEFRRTNPDNWYGDMIAGLHLVRSDKPDEALAALESADMKRPGTNEIREIRWAVFIQSDRWREAEAEARAQLASEDPYYQWAGNVYLARSELYAGRSQAAAAALEAATAAQGGEGALAGLSLAWAADLHSQRGDPAGSLKYALLARETGRSQWPEIRGLFYSGVALAELDRPDEAEAVAAELRKRADAYPDPVEDRQAAHLAALLARARGETEEALDGLTKAAVLLPPRGLFYMDRHRQLPDHTPLWYSLATTLQAAGRQPEAALWFERIVESRVESRNYPIRYARSLYRLAQIREAQNRESVARDLYRKFVDLWSDGDLDRRQVEDARSKIG